MAAWPRPRHRSLDTCCLRDTSETVNCGRFDTESYASRPEQILPETYKLTTQKGLRDYLHAALRLGSNLATYPAGLGD
jgi:hypothetical protein